MCRLNVKEEMSILFEEHTNYFPFLKTQQQPLVSGSCFYLHFGSSIVGCNHAYLK